MFDISLSVSGPRVPHDCAYALFSALCRLWPELHDRPEIGIHQLHGKFNPPNRDLLPNRLILRVPQADLPRALNLAGSELNLVGRSLRLGQVEALRPLVAAKTLYARLVTAKGRVAAGDLLNFVREELDRQGIVGLAALVPRTGKLAPGKDPFLRRTLSIHDRTIAGYAVTVSELEPAHSLMLQQNGIGGRRHFGCGLFHPVQTHV